MEFKTGEIDARTVARYSVPHWVDNNILNRNRSVPSFAMAAGDGMQARNQLDRKSVV